MITERDLRDAISELECARELTRSDCVALAAFYMIRETLYPEETDLSEYSFKSSEKNAENSSDSTHIITSGESEFLKMINGRSQEEVLPIMDELVSTIQVVNPRLYSSVMRRLSE